MTRRDLPSVAVERARGGNEPIHEVFVERLGPQVGREKSATARRRQLAGKPPGAVGDPDVKRLYTHGITGQPKDGCPASFIEEPERVHPIEPLEQAGAPFFPAVNQHLRVRAGAKLMAAALELAPQIEVIVQLAVENYPDAAVLVRHRLRPTLNVDDTE